MAIVQSAAGAVSGVAAFHPGERQAEDDRNEHEHDSEASPRAEAIAERAGLDIERNMLPMILAGAVSATCQVAVERWFVADSKTSLRPLLRRALNQLADARKV